MILWFWSIFLFVFIGTLVVIFCVNFATSKNRSSTQKETNKKVLKTLQDNNFNISKVFYINDNFTYTEEVECKKFIAIDKDNKKICLVNYVSNSLLIVNFNEILNYEIYENGNTHTSGGGLGGFVGGIFSAETDTSCKELKLIIRLNRYDTSQVAYNIISNTTFNIGLNKSSEAYKNCISTLQEVVSFLEVVKNENKENLRQN